MEPRRRFSNGQIFAFDGYRCKRRFPSNEEIDEINRMAKLTVTSHK